MKNQQATFSNPEDPAASNTAEAAAESPRPLMPEGAPEAPTRKLGTLATGDQVERVMEVKASASRGARAERLAIQGVVAELGRQATRQLRTAEAT